ncbi:MAG: FecR domain-containing protein [Bacteroidota bacterium]
MENHRNIRTLDELASNPVFREWVLKPGPETEAVWREFCLKNPDSEALAEEAKELVLSVSSFFEKKSPERDQLENRFRKVIQSSQDQVQQSSSIRRLSYKKLAIAASILLLLGILGGIWLTQPIQYQTYATTYGEWQTIKLEDGSVVKLNANSEIRLAKQWQTDSERKVWLTGEAFFEVAPEPTTNSPFVVITNEVSIRVLGTSFNVKNRGDQTAVFLEEGKIKLGAGKEEKYLDAGDFVVYSSSSHKLTQRKEASGEAHSSWKDGILILKDRPTQEIFTNITDIYGVEIDLRNQQLLELETTVRLPMDELEIAIPILEGIFNTEITQEGRRLIIH